MNDFTNVFLLLITQYTVNLDMLFCAVDKLHLF